MRDQITSLIESPNARDQITFCACHSFLGGVYMRNVAPARVSYRHDFLISYRVYTMSGSCHISLFEGTLHLDKIHV